MPTYSRMRALDAPCQSQSQSLTLPSIDSFRESLKRARYARDPVFWAKDVLNVDLWSIQREILESVRDNRYTAVPSCYESGKSFTAAVLVCWWIATHPPGEARVITTASTGDQVKAVLWHEISRAHARGKLQGRLNQTEWWLDVGALNGESASREEMVAFGRKPAEHNPTAIQGIHARYPLFVGDEAEGLPKSLLDAAKGLMGNLDARLLLIGNPESNTSEFAKACAPNSGYNVIRIPASLTPNFTGEQVSEEARHGLITPLWVEERKREWGEDSPMYKSKALAIAPENGDDTLIPLSWIRAAQERWDDPVAIQATIMEAPDIEFGCDVGGGNNKNVIARRNGRRAKIVLENNNSDTMATLESLLVELKKDPDAIKAKIDAIGIGHGASDRAKQIAADQTILRDNPDYARRAALVTGVEVGRPGTDPIHFANYRAEGFWLLRELFREGNIDIDPQDEQLAAQLSSLKYFYSSGRIQIESKRDMKEKRRLPSPDRADALMLAFLKLKPGEEEKVYYELTW